MVKKHLFKVSLIFKSVCIYSLFNLNKLIVLSNKALKSNNFLSYYFKSNNLSDPGGVSNLEITRKYAELKENLRNVNKNITERILEVLESSGSEILRAEHLVSGGQKVDLNSILILSDPMKRSIKSFTENIRTIGTSEKMATGSQFYIADYGGSKTQFIELIKNLINSFQDRDEPPFSQIITVIFNGAIDLTASYLGEKIEHSTAQLLTRQIGILQKDPHSQVDLHAFENFMELLLEFRRVKDAPDHLQKIHNYLLDLERISESTGARMKISNIRQELSLLPVIDEERLLKIVIEIMMYASKYKIIYLFLFDECDDWLSKIEEATKWDPNFLKRQYFFRKLYDRIPNLRLYQIYFFTPRAHEALRSERSDAAPGIQRIASDMIKVSNSGSYIQIREQGVYQGEEALEAVLKWFIILEKALQPADKEIFNNFLPILIDKVDNKLSRRKANSTIISTIRAYIQLTDDIKAGQNQYNLAERNPSHFLTVGNIIEKTFPSYLNFLNFYFMKKHVDVSSSKKIDGRFMSSRSGEVEIYAEIKSFKEPAMFKYDKAKQVIDCVQNLASKAVFFLFCPGLTEEEIKERFYEWKNLGTIASEVDLDNIVPIVISDQTLLNCLVGFESVPPSRLDSKLENFDKLLRLVNKDFHGKLLNLFPLEEKIPVVPTKPAEEVRSIQPPSLPEKPAIPTLQVPNAEQSYTQLLNKLKAINDTTKRTAVEIVLSLGNKQKVYTRRKNKTVKNAIRSPLLKNSFDDGVEFLKQHHIIHETGDSLTLNWDVFDKEDIRSDPKGLMTQIFQSVLDIISK